MSCTASSRRVLVTQFSVRRDEYEEATSKLEDQEEVAALLADCRRAAHQ